jgi:hypothetical protein
VLKTQQIPLFVEGSDCFHFEFPSAFAFFDGEDHFRRSEKMDYSPQTWIPVLDGTISINSTQQMEIHSVDWVECIE